MAGVTDALDGLIARLTSHPTSLGAWLDPMADKLLLVTTFVVLTLPQIPLTNHVPLWLTVLVISRDIVIVGVVAIVNLAVGPRTFRPSMLGKLATATFILANVVIMYFNWRMERSARRGRGDLDGARADAGVGGATTSSALRRLINEPPPCAVVASFALK